MHEVRFNQPLAMDARGRVTLPARLWTVLDSKRVHSLVLILHGACIRAYTPADFTERVEKPLLGDDAFDPYQEEKQLLRLGFTGEVDIDRQGRIVIPENFRQAAGLGGRLVVLSLLDRLEIWDADRFAAAWEAASARRAAILGGPGA